MVCSRRREEAEKVDAWPIRLLTSAAAIAGVTIDTFRANSARFLRVASIRSADFQSAVLQVFNLRAQGQPKRIRDRNGLPIGNRRYSRVELCATLVAAPPHWEKCGSKALCVLCVLCGYQPGVGPNDSLLMRPDTAPDGACAGVAGVVLQRGRPTAEELHSTPSTCLAWVARATRPPRSATRRAERERRRHATRTSGCERYACPFRRAGRPTAQASRLCHLPGPVRSHRRNPAGVVESFCSVHPG